MIRLSISVTGWLLLSFAAGVIPSAADEVKGDLSRGAKFYSDNCARCHNARPPLEHRDREWSIIVTHMRLAAGLPGSQARDIEVFLRASNNPPVLAARREPSVPILDQYGCRGCHIVSGTGGMLGPNLDTIFERRDEAWIRAQIENPRQHNPVSVMPVFGFTDAQIDEIIETLRKPE